MIESKRKRLENKGWKIGSAREFLDLTSQEEAYIELRLKLADALKHSNPPESDARGSRKGSEFEPVASRENESRRCLRFARLLVRSLLAMGASNSDLAKIIAGSHFRQKAA